MHTETFQYLTEIFPEREIQERLGELGSVGWELVTAHWEEYTFGGRSHYQARCILKRRTPTVDEFAETLSAFSSR
jgi:hypothetical protein